MARDWEDDARCILPVTFAADSLAAMKQMLDPDQLMHEGCRVIKHPDCCVLCVLNNDCEKLPVHVNCRCEKEFYFGTADHFLEQL